MIWAIDHLMGTQIFAAVLIGLTLALAVIHYTKDEDKD